MQKYNFDEIINRRNSESLKWRAFDDDVLPLWVADMDYKVADPIVKALHERVDHEIYGYPYWVWEMKDYVPALSRLIVERMDKLYQWKISPEDIIYLPGVVTGFNQAIHAFVQKEQTVYVQTPVYGPILHASESTGVKHQEMELTRLPNGAYEVDWDKFEETISDETAMFLLCNPHNPIGKVFRKQELERLAEICLKHDLIICSDEIHGDIIYNNHKHIPIASLSPEIANNTVTFMAPSKTFNIPGLQLSFAIIQNQALRKKFKAANLGLTPWVNIMGRVAATAAYRDAGDWLNDVLGYLEKNRDFVYQYIQTEMPEIRMGMPEGTYLAWLDCSELDIAEKPSDFFLKYARVAMNDGAWFGKGGQNFVRLNFATSRAILGEALERMKAALTS